MLKNSRVIGTLDIARLGKAVSTPGIDPRTWVALAFVEKVRLDEKEGVFVDVIVMPTKNRATARVGTIYSGVGWGVYAPLEVNDEVLVEAPNGDPNNGLVITQRLHSKSDPPPSQAIDNPDDLLVFVKPGKTCRILTSGGGNVVISAQGNGNVLLGAESATRGVAREADTTVVSGTDLAALQLSLDSRYAIANPLSSIAPVSGKITTASSKVKST